MCLIYIMSKKKKKKFILTVKILLLVSESVMSVTSFKILIDVTLDVTL